MAWSWSAPRATRGTSFTCSSVSKPSAGANGLYVNAPRTLDLDLILCGDEVVEMADLVVPHPRFRERAFVLEPLAVVAPGIVDPVTTLTARELLARLLVPRPWGQI